MADTNKSFSCCHINTRSILAYNTESKSNQEKMDEIRNTLCNQYNYNVIGVTETWLTAATPSDDADLHIDNYTFYRKDREYVNGRGGGVGIFVSNNLLCVPRMDLSPRETELLWV